MGRIENGVFADSYNCLTMVANWVEALHDKRSISSSLDNFVRLVGAQSLTLSRYRLKTQGSRSLLHVNLYEGSVPAPRRCPPMAHNILGDQLESVKPGGLFLASEHGDQMDSRHQTLRETMADYETSEIALVSLGCTRDYCEFLEIHFGRHATKNLALLAIFPPILASTWQNRGRSISSRMSREALTNRLGENADPQNVHLLDAYNPAKLSRSEFRICSLLSHGQCVKKIAESLSVSQSTVRSHLRSIYSKTGTSGQLELLHRLTTSDSEITQLVS